MRTMQSSLMTVAVLAAALPGQRVPLAPQHGETELVAAPQGKVSLTPEQAISRGLDWLVRAQSENGGYGQDGVEPRGEVSLESTGTDVANTAFVALAMLRTGTTPRDGEYTDALLRAVAFILSHIEAASDEGLAITDRTGTQIQRKLGPFVDTFVAAQLLAELKGRMPDDDLEVRVQAALDKCIAKIEKNQGQDGSWNHGGWASILSTSLASRCLFTARQRGAAVDSEVLAKVDEFTKNQFDGKEFKVGGADAGVALYSVGQALEQAGRTEDSRRDNVELISAAASLTQSPQFIAGFGSMGGEEFISYMNISDSLARQGGEAWMKWNESIKDKLIRLQNADGTWAGHHCVTGRVACTSAAILTLSAERSAVGAVARKD